MIDEQFPCQCGCGENAPSGEAYISGHDEQWRNILIWKHIDYEKRFRAGMTMPENKNCPTYLGCYVAEQLLIKIFKNVQRMPYGNHGFDIICNRDLKIDIKSSATGNQGSWQFLIRKNTIADYFLCIAFEDREDLNPIHLWLIPGKDINYLTIIAISKRNITKWSKYEQPLDKVIKCCDEMKE